MRDRNLRDDEEQNLNTKTTLRRSPRFPHEKQPGVEYPETPNLAERKPRPDSFSTPLVNPVTETRKNKSFSDDSSHNSEKDPGGRVDDFDLRKQRVGKVEKRGTTRSGEVVVSDERKTGGDVKKVMVGQKKKRNQVGGSCDFIRGWNEEQESALRGAYLTEKPTPHYWKKVARMVPGKSAKDCFNRIHSDHITPSRTQKRSRSNKNQTPSPLPFSASKLLHSPAAIKAKNPRARRKTLEAQKTVRHLLEKQRMEDQDCGADLFSILEPTNELLLPSHDFQETTPFASPLPSRGGCSALLTRCLDTSPSGHAKQFSGIKADFVSPPVLKQIKNKALHEKYIDKLHRRDAKRKAQSLRNAKSMQGKENKVIPVRVAKGALFSDVQDAIDKLHEAESSTDNEVDDEDDDVVTSLDDENGLC